jgi:hypothetical protein
MLGVVQLGQMTLRRLSRVDLLIFLSQMKDLLTSPPRCSLVFLTLTLSLLLSNVREGTRVLEPVPPASRPFIGAEPGRLREQRVVKQKISQCHAAEHQHNRAFVVIEDNEGAGLSSLRRLMHRQFENRFEDYFQRLQKQTML